MREFTHLSESECADLVRIKLHLVGLPQEAAFKMPAELSGGMKKRAALARALALDPPIIFLDEPTSGLDPISADAFDRLILYLRETLGLTVIIITHDLDSLYTICDHVAVLVDKKIIVDTLQGIVQNPHPWIQEYFHGARARAAFSGEG
jgi:phospholipid/cholesterol/gamma-HCH transport system ATP-binding protein